MRKSAGVFATAAAVAVLLAPVPGAAAELPTRAEIQAQYPDQLNRFSFPPSGFTLRTPVASWTRLSEVTFANPRDERLGRAVHVDPTRLAGEQLRLYQRTDPAGALEYLLVQEVATGPTNFFPVFRGTPAAFSFDDQVTEPGEGWLTCRTLREFLACREIQLVPHRVSYQTFQLATAPTTPAPTDRELRRLFADQRGRWSFRPPDATAWTLAAHWRRVAQIAFDASADERTAEPELVNPIPKELRLFTRTVHNHTEVGLVEWADRAPLGGGELLNLFPDFSGDLQRWVFYDTNAIPGATYQETCRGLRKDDTDFLLCRTILQGQAAFYQTYVRV